MSIIGIDFGTKLSTMALIENRKPIVIPNSEGSFFTPSVVSFDDEERNLIVGSVANRQAVLKANHTVFSVKRLFGKRMDHAYLENKSALSSEIIDTGNSANLVGQLTYSPKEMAAFILQKLKRDAENYSGENINATVITAPVSFNTIQRQILRSACSLAGFGEVHIIGESTSVCLSSMFETKKEEKVLIFNLGAGALSISIIDCGEGVFEVKSIVGDDRMGGDDVDQCIIEWLCDYCKKEQGWDIYQDTITIQRLRQAVEIAKCELSSNTQVDIKLPFVPIHDEDYANISITITRDKLNDLCAPFIKQSLFLCEKALELANLSHIDRILFSGQQARMPAIQAAVQNLFGNKVHHKICLPEAAAIGAAIYGGVITGRVREVLPLDLLPISVGVELKNNKFSIIVVHQTTIPTIKSQIFSVETSDVTTIIIHVLQGEHELASQNCSIGTFELSGLPTINDGVKQFDVEITIEVKDNGILIASAEELSTRKYQKAVFCW